MTPATRVRQEDPEGAGAGLTRLTRPGGGRGLGGRGGTGLGVQKDMEAKPPPSVSWHAGPLTNLAVLGKHPGLPVNDDALRKTRP